MRQLLSFCVLFTIVCPSVSQAAMLYLDPPREVLQQGDASMIAVRLDVNQAEGVCINTADVTVTYPDTIQAVDVSTRHSIFPLWVEQPKIDAENNQVTFAGGIPNGYCGRIEGDPGVSNVLAEIVFRSVQPITEFADNDPVVIAPIEFADSSTLYVNDSFGTSITPEMHGATMSVFPSMGVQLRDPWRDIVQADTQPPEPFSIQLDRDANVFGGDYFITFNTTDKQSGIAVYEVMEEPLSEQHLFRFGEAGAPWVQSRSPHRLEDQTLNSTIRVRAIDKAGNEYVATLVPDPSLRTRIIQVHEWVLLALFVLVVISLPLGWYYQRARITRRPDRTDNEPTI